MSAKSPSSKTKRARTSSSPIRYTPVAKQADIVNLSVFNNKAFKVAFEIDSMKRLRTMIEKGNNPQRQCNESIGTKQLVDPESYEDKLLESGTTDNHHCWLCRFPLYRDTNLHGKSVQDESVHCEHILPIMVGLVFTGIAGSKRSDPKRSEQRKNLEKLNYAWAHGPCNLLKSNMLLLKYGDSSIEFDETEGAKLAKKIADHVFKTDRGGTHSHLNTAYAQFATPVVMNEDGKEIKPRTTRNSNLGIDLKEQKKSKYESDLIEHYKQVIQDRTVVINKEIQQFNQGFGTGHTFNEYLSYIMTNIRHELGDVVLHEPNMYNVMHTIVEVAKASSQKREISEIENKIKKLEAQLDTKKKRARNMIEQEPVELSKEEIQKEEIQEKINELNSQIESIKSGMFKHPPNLEPVVRSISRQEDLATGRNLSREFDDYPSRMSLPKSGGRRRTKKQVKPRIRYKTSHFRSKTHRYF